MVPMSYAQFLTEYSNGLNVLGDSLCLFGYRANYIRDINAAWQPYSIVELNKFDKPVTLQIICFLLVVMTGMAPYHI